MKDILNSSKLDIIERSWTAVNPNKEYTISIPKVTQFLRLLCEEHEKLQTPSIQNTIQRKAKLDEKIHNFILKYILQRQLNDASSKKQMCCVKQETYMLDLKDCLEIWRWLREDENSSSKINSSHYDQLMQLNQFEIGQSSEPFEIKKNVNESNKNKKLFSQLLLEEQQTVIKKSLEMAHMYYHQFKIIFNHYCKCNRQNEYPKTLIFDEVYESLEKMNVNRFMVFCRDFDIIKIIQFKRKNEHNAEMNKQLLVHIFKKGAHLQKYLNFDAFLLSLVNISLKIHQNFDPRSYMHIELFLNSLKVKYYEQFVKRLDQIGIKYSPTQFLNCYKNIYKKMPSKNRQAKSSIFNNPHFVQLKNSNQIIRKQESKPKLKQLKGLNKKMRTESLPNIHSKLIEQQVSPIKKPIKQLHHRKVSLPVLPAASQNRFFTPIQHNNHLNGFSKYLETKVGESSSVFKNRITGYSNINKIKSSPFHQLDNPEGITKQSFRQFITDAKNKIDKIKITKDTPSRDVKPNPPIQNITHHQSQTKNQKANDFNSIKEVNPFQNHQIPQKQIFNNSIDTPHPVIEKEKYKQIKLPIINRRQTFIKLQPDNSILQSLKAKIDLRDDDELLNNHLLNEQKKQRSVNQRIIQALKKCSQ